MKTLIHGGKIVNENRTFEGSVTITDDRITCITEGQTPPSGHYDQYIDATGCFVLPGIIDTHVHFREPGLTAKADIESESRAAAWGGVTSFFDMPNTLPQTTTPETLREKQALAARKSHINYAFFYGATHENADTFALIDRHSIPGIKLFMGSSTGNMLVDNDASLSKIFHVAQQLDLPIVAHCEDTAIINHNMAKAKEAYGDDPNITFHPQIRSSEACFASTSKAVTLAQQHGTRLHVAHLTTSRELELFGKNDKITAEAVVAHLLFTEKDYSTLGARIKCNPAIKSETDRKALQKALTDGRITTVGTDHAPHLLAEKQGGCAKAVSGMPMIQFSLVAMLDLTDRQVLTIEQLVNLMAHQPSTLFSIRERGFLRPQYKADIAIVRPNTAWQVSKDIIQSKCKWSPVEGNTFHWKVEQTICNGQLIFNKGLFSPTKHGEAILFR